MSLAAVVSVPQAVLAAVPGAASISAGGDQSCAIESGKAYCWGENNYGQLGDGNTTNSSVPVAVDTSGVLAGKTLTQITSSFAHVCALDSTGAAYCWGWNLFGEVGEGTTGGFSSVPVAVDTSGVLAGRTLTQIAAGLYHTCAVDSTGKAYCWGYNQYGELGDGSTSSSGKPVAVDTGGVLAGTTLTEITAGDSDSTCALDSTGAAYCWGDNNFGEVGDDSTAVAVDIPVAVDTGGALAGKTLTQISTGFYDTCALDSASAAYCWGFNEYGELGDGSTTDSSVPVAVDSGGALAGKTLTQITAGLATCALDAGGAAYCWGDNSFGELGDGSTGGFSGVPVSVNASGALAGRTLTQITFGGGHACALDAGGAAYCWGDNTYGALGDGSSSTGSDVPVLAGPQAPTGVTAIPGDTTAAVSWTAPASLDGGTLTGYTATASPGGAACATTGATTCTITGLATGTVYSVTVVADTTAGDSGASAAVRVTPGSGLAFTSDPGATAAYGRAFRFTVTTAGSPAPEITKVGRLPSGLRFTEGRRGTAVISGIPARSAAGVYPLTLTARNKAGIITEAFALTVIRAPAIRKNPATAARIGVAFSTTITATGYPLPALTESGTLPAGLSFTDHGNGTATIAGTPATGSEGHYPIAVVAANQAGTARQTFTFRVR